MVTKKQLEAENDSLKDQVFDLQEKKKAWIIRELKMTEEQERLEDNYRQIIAQREESFTLKGAILIYRRITDVVPKEHLCRLIALCKTYECDPEGLRGALIELREITRELEEKLDI